MANTMKFEDLMHNILAVHIIVIIIVVVIIVIVVVIIVVVVVIVVDVDNIDHRCRHGLEEDQEGKDSKWIATLMTISSISLHSINNSRVLH